MVRWSANSGFGYVTLCDAIAILTYCATSAKHVATFLYLWPTWPAWEQSKQIQESTQEHSSFIPSYLGSTCTSKTFLLKLGLLTFYLLFVPFLTWFHCWGRPKFINEAQVSSSNIKCMENVKRSNVQSSKTASSVKMWKKELIKSSQGESNSKKVKKKESSQEESNNKRVTSHIKIQV